jgi:hypothetical protein
MDCSAPGFVPVDSVGRAQPVPPGARPGLPAAAPAVQGLEGALKTDRTAPLPETFTPNAFQEELQVLVNLPETIQTNVDALPGSEEDFLNDPVVTAPFYGQNHARQHRSDKVLLDVSKTGWYHDLNRDPRSRVPAGFGTAVVQKGQEKFVQKAWQQVQKVYEANRKIRDFQFTIQVAARYHQRFFAALAPETLLALTSPVHAKVLGSPTTIRHQIHESTLAAPVLSPAFRRLTRPTGTLTRRFGRGGQPLEFARLFDAVNDGRVTPAPPRAVPEGIPAVDDLASKIQPQLSGWMQWLVQNRRWLLAAALILFALAGFAFGAWILAGVLSLASLAGSYVLQQQDAGTEVAEALVDPAKELEAILRVPPRPDFRVALDGDAEAPAASPSTVAAADSGDARNFRQAASRLQQRLEIRAPEPLARQAFDMRTGSSKNREAIDPRVAFPRRLSALVQIPDRPMASADDIVDVMAHPDFEDAMYAHLRDINKELLIPNLQLIPANTISLLETNPKFIEAYMVGLNHEMGRELLWREYPTDLRGSYFRQFWDVKGVSNPDTPGEAEQLKDITKIHSWPASSPLGGHKPAPPPTADVQPGDKQVVLVIGAREAALHLVEEQQDPALVTDLAEAPKVGGWCRHEAALAEHGLDQYRGECIGGNVRAERILEAP